MRTIATPATAILLCAVFACAEPAVAQSGPSSERARAERALERSLARAELDHGSSIALAVGSGVVALGGLGSLAWGLFVAFLQAPLCAAGCAEDPAPVAIGVGIGGLVLGAIGATLGLSAAASTRGRIEQLRRERLRLAL